MSNVIQFKSKAQLEQEAIGQSLVNAVRTISDSEIAKVWLEALHRNPLFQWLNPAPSQKLFVIHTDGVLVRHLTVEKEKPPA
jgi:hypothetical protein